MDNQGWISDYINGPAELLHSFKFLCWGFVCLQRSTHTSWTVAAYSVLTSAVETKQLSCSFKADKRHAKEWQITAPYARAHALSRSEGICSGEQSYSDFSS